MRHALVLSSLAVLLNAELAAANPALTTQACSVERAESRQPSDSETSHLIDNVEYIYDGNGAIIGRFDAAGNLYNQSNRIIAQNDISGYLLNVDGTLLMRDRLSRAEVIRLFF